MTSDSTPRDPQRAIRRLNLIGAAAVGAAIIGVGGWATATDIAGAVIASGSVVVESSVKQVQHPTGGIVGAIFVKEGQEVEAGQVLLRLDDTLTRATLGIVQAQLDGLQARRARLIAERDGGGGPTFPPELLKRQGEASAALSIVGEEKLFEARRGARTGQQAQLRERIVQIENEIRGLAAQQQAKEKEIRFLEEELGGVADLYQKQLVTIVRFMALQREQAKLKGEHGQLVAEIARARGRIAETELQLIQLDRDFRTEVLRDLRETEARIAELEERANAAQDELKRIEIRAPQTGFVHQLTVHTIGGVIGKGEIIMQIVPRRDALVVDAKVAPQDIDQIALGASVKVRLLAGNRPTMPDLEGRVLRVGADLTREPNAAGALQTYYLVRVGLLPGETAKLGDLEMVPGMPAEVFIRTQDRTPLDYLVKPLRDQIARTFRER
ncbi:MAG TPA: HlyD family type I secretion periplasmic adaptor subunit [Xanthobacteraceae bacterium]|nr:HlyD family type I secretion periplasmic adaptor subunit [Xanthobacteraceae bacterium]